VRTSGGRKARARREADPERARPRAGRKGDAERRVLHLLDQSWPGWRARVRWQRGSVSVHCTGAVDLPGTTWRDRPDIGRGKQLKIATDQSATLGLLAETGIAAAQLAVEQLAMPT